MLHWIGLNWIKLDWIGLDLGMVLEQRMGLTIVGL